MNQNYTANALAQLATAWIAACFRWLTSTLCGCLALALAAYFYLEWRGPVHPLTLSRLLNWYIAQDHQTKIGLGGMMLTMLGFMFAFWTTSSTWRRHRELELRIEAAKEINQCFQRIFAKQLALNSYLAELSSAIALARANPVSAPAIARLASINSRGEVFIRDRGELDIALVGLNDLRAGYPTIFANVFRVSNSIERAQSLLLKALLKYWSISPPVADPRDPNFVAQFLEQCDDAALRKVRAAGDSAHTHASTLSGYARGRLLARVVPATLPALLGLTAKWKHLVSSITTIEGK